MRGKYFLLNSLTLLAMGSFVVGCSGDDVFDEQYAMDNAEEVLGVEIAAGQDWKMSSTAETDITINIDYGETYSVSVYSNDPLTSEYGYVLTQGTVENGQRLQQRFEYASADKYLFVGITDSHGHTYYRTASVVDGRLTLNIGQPSAASRTMFRSKTAPDVPDITIPNDAYAKSFLDGAKEPTDANTTDNHDNSYYVEGTPATQGKWVAGTQWGWGWNGTANTLNYNYSNAASQGVSAADIAFWDTYCAPYNNGNWAFYGADNQNDAATKLIVDYLRGTGRSSWANVWAEGSAGHYKEGTPATEGHWVYDETYVKKFKITGTYNKGISVLSTEAQYGDARTVYISGKWTVASPDYSGEQRVGGGAVIVVDNGGELNIPSGITMTFVNEARLVVMPGGKVTGDGNLVVTNGNAVGLEGYNGGSIDIGMFNNNFGKFYNYGTFKCTDLKGGAGLSNFYNHGVVHIEKSGKAESWGGNYDTPNTRIYNACQWYCEKDMRAYVIEMTQGSYFKVGGELMMSDGTDGDAVSSYVALAAGALMDVGTLWNNNTSWVGPASGYAVLQAGGLSYVNWTGNEPVTSGYFINNIAVSVDDATIGAKYGQGTDTYVAMRDFLLNGYGTTGNVFDPIGKTAAPEGNGGAVMVNKGCANMNVAADEGFVLGTKGCTPGYNPTTPPRQKVKASIWSYAFEDSWKADYDMNDVVLKVSYHQVDDYTIDSTKIDLTLCCTGASYNLYLYLGAEALFGGREVHEVLNGGSEKFINTDAESAGSNFQTKPAFTETINKPEGFVISSANFWVNSPERAVQVSKQDEDPHGVVIPGDWRWPKEFVCIKNAYPDFINFAKDPSNPEYEGWYKGTVIEDALY